MRAPSLRTFQSTEDDSQERWKELGSLAVSLSCCINQSWNHLDFLCEILTCHYLSQLSKGFCYFQPKAPIPPHSHPSACSWHSSGSSLPMGPLLSGPSEPTTSSSGPSWASLGQSASRGPRAVSVEQRARTRGKRAAQPLGPTLMSWGGVSLGVYLLSSL